MGRGRVQGCVCVCVSGSRVARRLAKIYTEALLQFFSQHAVINQK